MKDVTTKELVKKFKNVNCKELFAEIVKRVMLHELSEEEMLEIWRCDKRFKELVLLRAPREIIVKLTLEDKNISLNYVKKRLGDLTKEETKIILNSLSASLKNYAISYALEYQLIDELVEMLCEEDSEYIAKNLLEKIKINERQANKLLNAKNLYVILYAIKFASKKAVLERLIKEKSTYSREKIAFELKKHHKLTAKDVKPFIDDFYINILLLEFYSTKDIITILTSKKFRYKAEELKNIIEILEGRKITQPQYLKLIKTEFFGFKVFSARNLSKNNLVELLNDKSIDWDTANEILNNLQEHKISSVKSDEVLLNSKLPRVKLRVLETSSNYATVANLYLETQDNIIEKSLEKMQDFKLSEELASYLMHASEAKVRRWAVKFVNQKELIEALNTESNISVLDEILTQLQDYKFSKEEVEKFVKGDCYYLKKYFLKYATKELLLDVVHTEKHVKIIDAAVEFLVNHNVTEDEYQKFLKHSSVSVRKFAIKFASAKELQDMLSIETDKYVLEEIVEKLWDFELDVETANNIYQKKREHLVVVKYVSKYLNQSDVLEYLMNPDIDSIERKILYERLKDVM